MSCLDMTGKHARRILLLHQPKYELQLLLNSDTNKLAFEIDLAHSIGWQQNRMLNNQRSNTQSIGNYEHVYH